MEKKYRQNMSEEDKQKERKKEFMKEYEKKYSSNVLKKQKQNNESKIIEVYPITNFIKDKVESFSSDAEVYTDHDDVSEDNRVFGCR